MRISLLASIFWALHRLSGDQSILVTKDCQDLNIFGVHGIYFGDHDHFSISTRLSCFQIAKHIYWDGAKNCTKVFNKTDIVFGDETCRFNFDSAQKEGEAKTSSLQLAETLSSNSVWTCKLKGSNFCDGFSDCLTDECGCHGNQTDVFYCADGSGCITWNGICDDTQDCLDGSDECSCPGHVVFSTHGRKFNKVCMSEEGYCHTKTYLQQLNLTSDFGIIDDDIDCKAYETKKTRSSED